MTQLSNKDDHISLKEGTAALDLLRKTCEYISSNWNYSKSEITKLMMTLDLGNLGGESIDQNEREECAAYISENIVNMKAKIRWEP